MSRLLLNALDGWELSAVAEDPHHRGVHEEAGAIAQAVGPAEVWADRRVRSRVVDHRDRRFFETERDASHFPDPDEIESIRKVAIVDSIDPERRRVRRVGIVEEMVSPPVAVHTAKKENQVRVEPDALKTIALQGREDLGVGQRSLVPVAEDVHPG